MKFITLFTLARSRSERNDHHICRDDKIRTCDHQTPSLVRYRTALRPEITGCKSKP
jgi:hypothetical protein